MYHSTSIRNNAQTTYRRSKQDWPPLGLALRSMSLSRLHNPPPRNARSVALTKRTSLRYCVPVDVVTSQVAASNIAAVNAITCDFATALPGNTGASVLQAVPASDRILRRQKGSQPDDENLVAAALVLLSADHDADN